MAELTTSDYQKIGARIREVRIKRNMSQADLANAAHISLPHVRDIELGKTKMYLTTFMRITEALQVSADELLRPDTPQVNVIYQSEFKDVLSDLTPDQIDFVIKFIKDFKTTLKTNKEQFE